MQLPPLMSRKSETRSSRSPAHTDESSRPESAQSTHSDYQTSTTTTSQTASKSATAEQQASNTTVSRCIHNLGMSSEFSLCNISLESQSAADT